MVQSGFPLCENGPPNKGTQSVGGERRHHPDPHSTREERSAAALHNVKFAYLCCFGTRGRGVPVFARCHDVVFHAAFVVPGGGKRKKQERARFAGRPAYLRGRTQCKSWRQHLTRTTLCTSIRSEIRSSPTSKSSVAGPSPYRDFVSTLNVNSTQDLAIRTI